MHGSVEGKGNIESCRWASDLSIDAILDSDKTKELNVGIAENHF